MLEPVGFSYQYNLRGIIWVMNIITALH